MIRRNSLRDSGRKSVRVFKPMMDATWPWANCQGPGGHRATVADLTDRQAHLELRAESADTLLTGAETLMADPDRRVELKPLPCSQDSTVVTSLDEGPNSWRLTGLQRTVGWGQEGLHRSARRECSPAVPTVEERRQASCGPGTAPRASIPVGTMGGELVRSDQWIARRATEVPWMLVRSPTEGRPRSGTVPDAVTITVDPLDPPSRHPAYPSILA